jgi:hypothetical protein
MINNVFSLFQNNDKNESISINDMNISRLNNNSIELETTKGEHLCLMYKCEEHLGCYRDTNDLIKSKSLSELISGDSTKNHSRNLSAAKCKKIGLNIKCIEKDEELSDIILSIHNACISYFYRENSSKIYLNQNGTFLSYNFE